jgi:hypothetical protein
MSIKFSGWLTSATASILIANGSFADISNGSASAYVQGYSHIDRTCPVDWIYESPVYYDFCSDSTGVFDAAIIGGEARARERYIVGSSSYESEFTAGGGVMYTPIWTDPLHIYYSGWQFTAWGSGTGHSTTPGLGDLCHYITGTAQIKVEAEFKFHVTNPDPTHLQKVWVNFNRYANTSANQDHCLDASGHVADKSEMGWEIQHLDWTGAPDGIRHGSHRQLLAPPTVNGEYISPRLGLAPEYLCEGDWRVVMWVTVNVDQNPADVPIDAHADGYWEGSVTFYNPSNPAYNGCNADYNQDGVVDGFDLLDYLDDQGVDFGDRWNLGTGIDTNGDCIVDFFDYLDLLDQINDVVANHDGICP